MVNTHGLFSQAYKQGWVPRRDTSSFRGIKVVPPLCFGLECGQSGDASSADGNAAEDLLSTKPLGYLA